MPVIYALSLSYCAGIATSSDLSKLIDYLHGLSNSPAVLSCADGADLVGEILKKEAEKDRCHDGWRFPAIGLNKAVYMKRYRVL